MILGSFFRKHQVFGMKCAHFWNEDTDNGVLEDHLDQKEKSWKIPLLKPKRWSHEVRRIRCVVAE